MNIDNAVHTEEKDNYTLSIFPEDYPLNPRKEFDSLGIIVLTPGAQRNYGFGDMTTDSPDCPRKAEIAAILPVYLLDHSGLSVSTGSFSHIDPGEWDSGQCGWIIMTREAALKKYGYRRITKARRQKLEKYLAGEIAMLNACFTGDVYGYEITDRGGEFVDSCWGFYATEHGWTDATKYGGALQEGRNALNFILAQLPVDLGIGI